MAGESNRIATDMDPGVRQSFKRSAERIHETHGEDGSEKNHQHKLMSNTYTRISAAGYDIRTTTPAGIPKIRYSPVCKMRK